jgi:hypothetical protein
LPICGFHALFVSGKNQASSKLLANLITGKITVESTPLKASNKITRKP